MYLDDNMAKYDAEQDFEDELMDILQDEYPKLYKKIENSDFYLDWEDALDQKTNKVRVFIMQHEKNKNTDEQLGTITFKADLEWNDTGYEQNGIEEETVKVKLNK